MEVISNTTCIYLIEQSNMPNTGGRPSQCILRVTYYDTEPEIYSMCVCHTSPYLGTHLEIWSKGTVFASRR